MLRICTILTIALISVTACDSWEAVETDLEPSEHDQNETPVKAEFIIVRGHYVYGFEASYFYPCGSNEKWWVSGNRKLIQDYSEIATGINEHVYVKLAGNITALGQHGHMGGADRSFRVNSVIEIRKQTDNDCN